VCLKVIKFSIRSITIENSGKVILKTTSAHIHSIYFLLWSLPSNIYRFQVSTNKNHKMHHLKLAYRCINFQNKIPYFKTIKFIQINRSPLQHCIWAKYLLLLIDRASKYTHIKLKPMMYIYKYTTKIHLIY